MQRNQFGITKKSKLLHRTVKFVVSDISASFQTALWSDPTLDASGKIPYPIESTTELQIIGLPNNHQKVIPENLVLYIYRKHNSHLSTSIGQLVAGSFLFGMQSCEYSTTPKGENKKTCILRKVDSKFYRRLRELLHSSSRIHLADKVYPTLRTQKNDVKNSKVTQWWIGKHLCPVQIWSNITTSLESYPGTSDEPPINTVWGGNSRTSITSQITTKTLRSGTLSFGEERLGFPQK